MAGQFVGVHDGQGARGAREGGVESADAAVRPLSEDRVGINDDHGIELEPFDDVEVEEVDGRRERLTCSVGELHRFERGPHLRHPRRRSDHAHAANGVGHPRG